MPLPTRKFVTVLRRLYLCLSGLSTDCFYRCIVCKRGLCDRNAVRPSICPSVVTRVYCEKTNESCANILTPYESKIHLLSHTQRMVGGGRPLLREILGRTDPPSFKNGDFHSIFARSGPIVGPSEKSSIRTNRSSVRAYQ